MTREQQKEYNAKHYPASVLTWLNEATDRAYDYFENRSCDGCRWKDLKYVPDCFNDCDMCVRKSEDFWEPKDD